MKILSAEFVTSAVQPSQFPVSQLPEIAVAGRSNVGKSSLINALLRRKDLARVSQTPGRTRLINFFRVKAATGPKQQSYEFLLVDLPGYGYAKVAKAVKEEWGPMIETYLRDRSDLRALMVLTDVRRGEQEEVQLVRWGKQLGLTVIAVATKIDKISRGERVQGVRALEALLGVPVLGCSAQTGEGIKDVTEAMEGALASSSGENNDHGAL